jgi:hypothetical protein
LISGYINNYLSVKTGFALNNSYASFTPSCEYICFTRVPLVKELREVYTPTPGDIAFVATKARGPAQSLHVKEGNLMRIENTSKNS